MAEIDNVRRINAGDFKEEDRDTVSMIAETYNYFAEQVTNTLNGRVDVANLNRDLIELEIAVGSNGVPLQTSRFSANTGAIGTNIIRADNITNSVNYPDAGPLITFTTSGNGIYTIQHITGLPANNNFRLVFEIIYG